MLDGQTLPARTRRLNPALADTLALAIIVLATVLLRLSSFIPAVVDTDEGLYMVQAREWLHGGWPLVAAWDMHPIGAPALFAGAFLLFGVSVESARLLGLICVAITGCGLFTMARSAGAPRSVGVGAAVIYAAHTLLLSGLCTNTELLIAPFVTFGMALALRGAMRAAGPAPRAPGWAALAAVGLLFGCALIIKQVVAPAGCLAFALLLGPALLRGMLPWRRALAMAGAYAVLCATPFLLGGLLYWAQGWLPQYLDGSLLAPFHYAMERIPDAEAARRIGTAVFRLGLAFAAALAALVMLRSWRCPLAPLTGVAVAWFIAASLAVASPGFFFAHYFLLWLPPLSLLAAIGTWRLARALAQPHLIRPVFAGMLLVLASQGWLPEAAGRLQGGPGLFNRDPVREVAAAVAQAAGPGGDALIANYHPSVYVLAGVRTATRFPFPGHLTGEFEDLSDTSTEAELTRVLAAKPRVIVVDRGWMKTMRPAAAAQVMAAVAAGYDLAATVAEERGPVEIYRVRSTIGSGAGNQAEERPVNQ